MNEVIQRPNAASRPTEKLTGIVEGQVVPLTDAPVLSSAASPWSGFMLEELRADLAPNDLTWGWHRTHVCLVTRGTMYFTLKIAGRWERIVVREGDVVVFPSGFGESHFVYDGSKFQILVVAVDPDRLKVSNRPLPHVALKPQIGISDANIARLLSCMKEEVVAGCPSGDVYGQSLSLTLAAYLEGRFAYSPRTSTLPGQFSTSEVKILTDYIRANLDGSLNLSDLANLLGMSSRTFSRYFLRTFAVSPYRYILAQRLNEAKTLLLSGKKVADVACSVGFAPAHFSSTFRRIFGTSPRDFGLRHRSSLHDAARPVAGDADRDWG